MQNKVHEIKNDKDNLQQTVLNLNKTMEEITLSF
jgi:hypothetical protein